MTSKIKTFDQFVNEKNTDNIVFIFNF